ncbi:DNA-protecting protein DprA [Viridibacillus sp. YIM B01967]|uniref:DNA-protecting protein DprA n=1 Tax=Viridibacillus soli TaxID=2798301 RepID=A0ABS1H5S4_9BACL|nr:DNA-processing protein DprA [Viridibacillus soli]MBK3494403.1 DNA-protecting protein DprA [Viridibacillus soli]
MNEKQLTHRLLALHYVFPVPLNRLAPLFQVDAELEALEHMSTQRITKLLKLSYEKANKLKSAYIKMLETPLLQAYEQKSITPIPYYHPLFPKTLFDLCDPPACLYVKGQVELLYNERKMAIVGSRKATAYTEKALQCIMPPLVEHDYIVVSGLAKGADRMAHESAITNGGKTIAVLGHGLFHLYPKENAKLAEIISQNHLLVTEYPPYIGPKRWYFPMRNRIISGMSKAILVTEAAEKSGTSSTMDHALEHGKDIFVVPGDITSKLSLGPHKLLSEGATPVWNGYQIVAELERNFV